MRLRCTPLRLAVSGTLISALLIAAWLGGTRARWHAPLDSFVPLSHQARVFGGGARDAAPLAPALARARWRCDSLRWSSRGLVAAQLAPFEHTQPAALASAREEAWLNCAFPWTGHLLRLQVIGGVVYVVPPPAPLACAAYRVDDLRLRALAAILTRVSHAARLPDVDFLVNIWDDAKLTSGDDDRVPVFAFNRLAGNASRMVLLPLIAEPAYPFLDAEALAAADAASGGAGDERGCADGAAARRAERWARRADRAVFRGTSTGTRAALCDALNAGGAPGSQRAARLDVGLTDGAADSGPAAACHRGAAPLSMSSQARIFNAVLLVDGNAAAWRIVRQLPYDVLVIAAASCCETYVHLALDAEDGGGGTGEVWRVAADLSDIDAALARLVADRSAAMATAARSRAFALSHLNDDATTCYTLELFSRYACLMPPATLHPDAQRVF